MLGKYLQQTTSADDIFRCFFYWRFKGLSRLECVTQLTYKFSVQLSIGMVGVKIFVM